MSDRFGKFTERAKQVLVLAQEEAQRLDHNYIGTEHLLLGMIREGEGIAGQVLAGLGVQIEPARYLVVSMIGRGDHLVIGHIAMTPRAKRAIERAVEEARLLKHRFIGTEHLLLGLIRRDEDTPRLQLFQKRPGAGEETPPYSGVAIQVLERLGVDLEQVRTRVVEALAKAAGAMGTTGTTGAMGTTGAGDLSGKAPPRDNVVTCRVDERTLAALDALVEAGVHGTRSEAAARLIVAGLQANQELLAKVFATVAEIRRLREQTHALAQHWHDEGRSETP